MNKINNKESGESGGRVNSYVEDDGYSQQTRLTGDKEWQESIIKEVKDDFERRRQERRGFEARWQLNTNFAIGNQYSFVNMRGDVEFESKEYTWQEREVYNHIAPIIETRLAKLGRVRPKMSVRPASGDDNDIKTAKTSSKILKSCYQRLDMDEIVNSATQWSELTGSSFYKIYWDKDSGKRVGTIKGKQVYEGDVKITVCSPYEIFPNSLTASSIQECHSIIHAKALHVDQIHSVWGKRPQGDKMPLLGMNSAVHSSGIKIGQSIGEDYCVVIERYTRPTHNRPKGELVIVAGDELLYYGDLPYRIGKDADVDLPFVKQDAIQVAGSFYGISIVDRTIPIQRAYNAVKNRKHEFLNRIAVGVLAVEDGSVDVDNLEIEGLAPGKILLYRQGSSVPRMLDSGRVPPEFNHEEDRLRNEFITISGVSEIVRNSHLPGSVSSGTAIQLLLEQDDTRLSLSAHSIRVAIRRIAQYTVRLYKQFASAVRLDRVVGDNGEVELMSWKASDLSCDDVVFDSVNELSNTPAAKQNMLFELLRNGLLHDEEGRLPDAMRHRMLDALGYGGWENSQSLDALHIKRAEEENNSVIQLKIEDIDNHKLHIDIHTAYLLSGGIKNDPKYNETKQELLSHIREHRMMIQLEKEVANPQ